MAGRAPSIRADPGPSLPFFERLAPAAPPEILTEAIQGHSRAGDVVLDLHGRGGWVARAAIAEQRRSASYESDPLTRLLAEVVLRPPDVRHLDAAFQAIAGAPHGASALKAWLGELYASRCATCGRTVVLDELVWELAPDGQPRTIRRSYRCPLCREQLGRGEQRHGPPEAEDLAHAAAVEPRSSAWHVIHERFPAPGDDEALVGQLLDLHTPRQIVGLQAILERIEGDLRAAPVEAALRLAFLHALLPATRLNGYPGRVASLRVGGGRVRLPSGSQWRERNPWLAFEDGYRLVRGFVQRIEAGAHRVGLARPGEDLRSLGEGMANVALTVGTPAAFRSLAAEGLALQGMEARPRVRLILGQPPLPWTAERLATAYFATAWTLGREAASLLPVQQLFGEGARAAGWDAQAIALRRSLAAAAHAIALDGRAVLLQEPGGGPEGLVAAVLGGAWAGYRLVSARLPGAGEEAGQVRLVPPGAPLPPGPRTRAGVALPAQPGAAGDPDLVPGPGILGPPERIDARPFSAAQAAGVVTETAVAVLQARGEPASFEQLLGEILVGLDRAGELRRLAMADPLRLDPVDLADAAAVGPDGPGPDEAARAEAGGRHGPLAGSRVESLLALIRGELARPTNRHLEEIEPGQWWLAAAGDRAEAAVPLADRVEWAVFSLLSTAGRLSEDAFFDRLAGMFRDRDVPDETLLRACLESYRDPAAGPDAVEPRDVLQRRSEEHAELIGLLADLGHRLGLRVWIGRREQTRRVGGVPLAQWLDVGERNVHLPLVGRGDTAALEQVDCIWYVRHRATFLFEVEWTAMLGEPLLLRHARIPTDDQVVRFLVILPERVGLVRHKLARSGLLRRALDEGNWHVLKADHLRAFAAKETVELAGLEPFLGLDAPVEGQAEQLALFAGPPSAAPPSAAPLSS
ncbi:MAG: hypothetical protein ACXWNG_03210, partial [Candidatus Limnocylindrales bacterium]